MDAGSEGYSLILPADLPVGAGIGGVVNGRLDRCHARRPDGMLTGPQQRVRDTRRARKAMPTTGRDHQYRGMKWLLSFPSLTILLALSCLLTGEEAFHLLRSHPNSIEFYGHYSIDHHPGCVARGGKGAVLECPTEGYGSMIFICSHYGCGMKEPSTGLAIDPMEAKRIGGK